MNVKWLCGIVNQSLSMCGILVKEKTNPELLIKSKFNPLYHGWFRSYEYKPMHAKCTQLC